MKKLFYVLPILGLLFFISCDQDESEEIINQSTAFDQIEVTENTNSNKLNFFITPGLLGPKNVDALTNVTYTFNPTLQMINAIPIAKRKYRIRFIWQNPVPNASKTTWIFEIPSNSVNVKFPKLLSSDSYFQVSYMLEGNGKNYAYHKQVIVNND
ncbi:hypothetical protein [Aquimarina sp. AU58]|uniref:hypothetical protein n=1 Tax=Aquimarina sp. AU58 TaxID=1874112 RepID=UPI000D6E9A38|nr:hypothetical protein [Aquimarina sp. AU58]